MPENLTGLFLPEGETFYPALKRHYNLRISKGFLNVINFRTNVMTPVESKTLLILSLCDGTIGVLHLQQVCSEAFGMPERVVGEILQKIFERFMDAIDFLKEPSKRIHICDIKERIEKSKAPWPFFKDREDIPNRMSLVLTERCNHTCSYCFKSSGKAQEDELSFSEWMRVIDEAAGLGVQEIEFTGGEPALFDGFFELVNHANHKGIYARIMTNGSTFCNGNAARLRDSGAEYIHLALPAVTETVFERVTRTSGTLPKVLQAVSDLKKCGFYIRAKMVLTAENYKDAGNVLDFCISRGVDFIFLAPFILTPFSREGEKLIPSVSQLLKVREIAEQRKGPNSAQTIIGGPPIGDLQWRGPRDIVRCGGCKDNLIVLSNGDITFCEPLGNEKLFRFGNVRTQSLSSVWNSPKPDLPNSFWEQKVEEPCTNCEYLQQCGTGCLMYSMLYSDNPWSIDPRCFKQGIKGNCFAHKRHALTGEERGRIE